MPPRRRIDYWRQLGIITPLDMEFLELTLIGAGGIGSPTAWTLAKMGAPRLSVYDDDTVTAHNLPNQWFRIQDIGSLKVEALKSIIADYAPMEITALPEKFDGSQPLSGVVISGVDSMDARHVIWGAVKNNLAVPLYIEARMAAQVLWVNTLNPSDSEMVEWYEKRMYSSAEAVEAPCTERAVIYTVDVVAGIIANQVKKYVKGEDLEKQIIVDLTNLMIF